MNQAAVPIPEKLFFKIGEVCDITGVQAHVLRYWESEFPMLAPQKNRAGQRTYRKRDVEMVLRIKELLYEDQYTIAGAKKRLTNELRGASKLKVVTPEMSAQLTSVQPAPQFAPPPQVAEEQEQAFTEPDEVPEQLTRLPEPEVQPTEDRRVALRRLREQLHDLLVLLEADNPSAGARRR
ncbi:MAG TPA: MerR family transcriptional regulator [Pyrinomonadaceae bacterium]|nr:MerR family transcriptional regulator [Pyrinomonadaceae bacterium]